MPDILIRGVGFPKDNPVSFTLYPDGTVTWREYHAYAKHGNITNGVLIVQFPRAIELPPHGDLIERDKAIESAMRQWISVKAYDELLASPVIVPASEEGDA